jgi:hypothetical protein
VLCKVNELHGYLVSSEERFDSHTANWPNITNEDKTGMLFCNFFYWCVAPIDAKIISGKFQKLLAETTVVGKSIFQ